MIPLPADKTMHEATGALPLYDTHAHVFTDDVARYPIDLSNAREGEEALRLRIAREPARAAELLQWWDENGVSGGVAVQYNTIYKTDNRYTLDCADAHPERLSAVVILDATAPDTPDTLDRFVRERHATGLRLFGYPDAEGGYPWLDSPAALRTWEVANAHGLSMVLMYAPAGQSAAAYARFATLARDFPSTRIALDHFGWAGSGGQALSNDLRVLAGIDSIHFKLSTINFHMFDRAGIDSAAFVRAAADLFGADRMMWGSDVGNTLDPYAEMAGRARRAAALLDEDEARRFLGTTGRRLFGRAAED